MADQKETWFCRKCGGFDICHDAVAKWNPETELYEVEAVLDGTWCETCITETGGHDGGSPAFGIPGSTEEDDAEEE